MSHLPPWLIRLWQIDWEESTLATGRMCVKTGVNEELDELRRKYHGISSFLVRNLFPSTARRSDTISTVWCSCRHQQEYPDRHRAHSFGRLLPPGPRPAPKTHLSASLTIPVAQIGYLIVIPTPVNVSAPDDLEIEGWDYQVCPSTSLLALTRSSVPDGGIDVLQERQVSRPRSTSRRHPLFHRGQGDRNPYVLTSSL